MVFLTVHDVINEGRALQSEARNFWRVDFAHAQSLFFRAFQTTKMAGFQLFQSGRERVMGMLQPVLDLRTDTLG